MTESGDQGTPASREGQEPAVETSGAREAKEGSAPKVAGRYRLERQVGAGAAGRVFRAVDEISGGLVALKQVELSALEPGLSTRVAREIEILEGLRHPRVVRLLDHGTTSGGRCLHLVFEWLEGTELGGRPRGSMRLRDALEIGAQAADGLASAHAAGVIHRDVKPGNLFIVAGPAVDLRVIDFGVALQTRRVGGLTRAGAILGTPSYMAPEQARGASEVDARADVFGLGAVLYELLSGVLPWRATSDLARLARILAEDAQPLSVAAPELPSDVGGLVDAMLAREPEARPETMGEVGARLRALLGGLPERVLDRPLDAGPSARLSPPDSALERTLPLPDRFPAEKEERARVGSALAEAKLAPSPSGRLAGAARVAPGAFEEDLATQAGQEDALAPLPEAGARDVPFVRGPLLERIASRLEDQLERLRPATFAVVESAGLGKSALRRRLVERLARPGGPRVWSAPARAEESAAPFAYVARLLRGLGRIPEGADTEARRAALERLVPAPARLGRLWLDATPALERAPALPEAGPANRLLTAERLAEREHGGALSDAEAVERQALVRAMLADLLRIPHPEIPPLRAARRAPRHYGAQLRRAVVTVLRAWAERRGLVIVVDEAQQLDLASSAVLGEATAAADLPLVVVGLGPRALLDAEAGPLGLPRPDATFDVPPLEAREARRLVDAWTPSPIAPDARERLIEVAAGSPLHLRHALLAAVADGTVRLGSDGRLLLAPHAAFAPTVSAALSARIARLEASSRRVLTAAAVFETDFELHGLARVLGVHGDEAGARARPLLEGGWIERVDADRLELEHRAVRSVALSRVPRRTRQRDEAEVAAWLGAREGGSPAAIIARHLARAGRTEAAAEGLRAAAEESLARGDAAGARMLAAEGLERAEDAGLVAELSALMFEAAHIEGDLPGAAAALERWRRQSPSDPAAEIASSRLARAQGRPAEALAAAERALAGLEDSGALDDATVEGPERPANDDAGAAAGPEPHPGRADDETARRAPSPLRSSAVDRARAAPRRGRIFGEALRAAARAAELLGEQGRARALYARLDAHGEPAAAALGLGRLALAEDRPDAARAEFARALEQARSTRHPSDWVRALLGRAEVERVGGQLERARAELLEAERRAPGPDEASRVRLAQIALLPEELRLEDALVRIDWLEAEPAPLDVTLRAAILRGRCLRHHDRLELTEARLASSRSALAGALARARGHLPALVPALESGLALAEWLDGAPSEGAERIERAWRAVRAHGALPGDEGPAFHWTRARLLAASGAEAEEAQDALREGLRAADAVLGRLPREHRHGYLGRPIAQGLLAEAETLEVGLRQERGGLRIVLEP